MLSRRLVLGAAAIALIAAAAPAQAAKIERLSKPGKESYFAFVEKAGDRAGAAEDAARKRSASSRCRTP